MAHCLEAIQSPKEKLSSVEKKMHARPAVNAQRMEDPEELLSGFNTSGESDNVRK